MLSGQSLSRLRGQHLKKHVYKILQVVELLRFAVYHPLYFALPIGTAGDEAVVPFYILGP